jgi:hypothetical protein
MPRTFRARRVVASLGALTLLAFVSSATATLAATPADQTVSASAVDFIKTKQQSDGGFWVVSPDFETRDSALAIAEQAQTGSTWSTTEARDALAAIHYGGGSGPTPLDSLDAYAASIHSGGPFTAAAGAAAKTIALSARPLGLDPSAFDANGTGDPVDLTALLDVDCPPSSSLLTFSDKLYALVAGVGICGETTSDLVADVRAAQQGDGGWGFDGNPSATGYDPDITGLAIQALVAAGVSGTDPAVRAALVATAHAQQSNGGWIDFFGSASNASSTSLVVSAIEASGFDPTNPCWRNTVAPELAATTYADPVAWMRSQQQPDGHIASPYDSFGVNTFTTSESVHALLGNWFPVERSSSTNCTVAGPPPTVSSTTPAAGGTMLISGNGFMAGTRLTIELHSDPIVLATTLADATGGYSVTVTIPADVSPGAHDIVVSGLGPDGQILTSTIGIDVHTALGGSNDDGPIPRFTG